MNTQYTNTLIEALNSITTWFTRRPLWLQVLLVSFFFVVAIGGTGIIADQALNDLQPNQTERSIPRTIEAVRSTFLRYDSNHYRNIATNGYNEKNVAFFPLYPMLVRGVHVVTGISVENALFIVSIVAFFGAMIIIAYWIRFELRLRNKALSPWAVLTLILVFPTSFFLVLGYTESTFLLFTVSALYAYRTKRYITATVLLSLATLTRVQGGALAVLCLVDYIRLHSQAAAWKRLIPIVGAIVGLGIYMAWLWVHFGSPLAFIEAQRLWGRLEGNWLSNIISSLRPVYLWYLPILGFMLLSVKRHLGWNWFIYALVFILIPLASGRLDSLNRYIIGLPVFFLALALAMASKDTPRWVRTSYLVGASFVLAYSILLFFNDYWVG